MTDDDERRVEAIRSGGWIQGSIAQNASFLPDDSLYVLISHPCDVVSVSFERDSDVEFLRADEPPDADGNFTYGKNSRRLDLETKEGIFSVAHSEPIRVDRRELSTDTPQKSMDEASRRILASWLAARYARPAFADEFNRRLSGAQRKIQKLLKSGGKKLSGIYIATSLEEKTGEDAYAIDIVVTMRAEDHRDAVKFADAAEVVDNLAAFFGEGAGLNVARCELFSEEETPLSILRTHARWDAQALSFRDGEDASHPADAP